MSEISEKEVDVRYLLDDAGLPLEVGGGDVLATVEGIPSDPVLAFTAAWNACRRAFLARGEEVYPGQFEGRVVAACRAYMNTYDVLADEVREHMQICMADALRASDALALSAAALARTKAVAEDTINRYPKIMGALARAEANAEGGDRRPADCRSRLQEEGKPYPRSGCRACGANIRSGLRCPYAHPAPQPSGPVEALEDALRGLLKAYENAFDWTAELPPETAEAERIANEVLEALTSSKPEQAVASGLHKALAEIDRHIDAAKRMANDPYYKGSFPASIVIQDLQELRDAVAAAPAAPKAGGGDAE